MIIKRKNVVNARLIVCAGRNPISPRESSGCKFRNLPNGE